MNQRTETSQRSRQPLPQDARRSTPLAIKLQDRIARYGPIPVATYVNACQSDPDYGYYIRKQAIGAAADFVTAPEISQIFGELIGIWCALVWQQLGEPEEVNLLELGPGRGTLMVDVLRTLAKIPKLSKGLRIHLLEINQTLKKQQRRILQDEVNRLTHHETHLSLCAAAADTTSAWIVIGNEFLDALGVRQLISQNGVWHERMVTYVDHNRLEFGIGEAIKHSEPAWPSAEAQPDGQILELMPSIGGVVTPLMCSLAQASAVASLFIDYGYEQTTCGDTLQAVRNHTYEHPLTSPGEADLTAHVNFADAERRLQEAGFLTYALLSQAEFLGRLGIVERTSRLMSVNPVRAAEIEVATSRLMSPNGMGSRFKVLAASSANVSPLPIFDLGA